MTRVIVHESICPIVSTITGLNIRCIGNKCPNYNKEWHLCQQDEPIRGDE